MPRIVIVDPRMRRMALVFAAFVLAVQLAAPLAQAQNGAQTAQALVGRWEWQDTMNGAAISHQLTLAGGGAYTYTSAIQSYQVTSWGQWACQGQLPDVQDDRPVEPRSDRTPDRPRPDSDT